MASSFKALVVALLLLVWAPHAPAGDAASLRFVSFAVRDLPPTRAEAEAWAAGAKPLADFADGWLATPEHEARVGRFIGDLLGVANGVQVGRGHLVLSPGAGGALVLPGKEDCNADAALAVPAWWLDGGETAKVCPSSVSGAIAFGSGKAMVRCAGAGAKGIGDPRCGCGPEMMLCLPATLVPKVRLAVIDELPRRGREAYVKDWTWLDLFGGASYVGDRYGYWRYVFTQFAFRDAPPEAADLAAWKSLPLEGVGTAPFPSGAARAGIVTAPGFLSQNNNFRARTRALVEALLCRPIEATLNTAGYTDLANPDLAQNDRKHVARADCASCHLFLDNIGPALFAFAGDGSVRAASKATSARAFGEDGDGPAFIAHALVERAPGFGECMAKRAWESFTGTPYDGVGAADRAAFAGEAGSPRRLVRAILRSPAFLAARAPTAPPAGDAAPAPERAFAAVAPIFAARCADARCHGPGSAIAAYVDQPQNVDAAAKRMLVRIQLGGAGQMPPADSGRSLTAGEKAALIAYLQGAP